MLRALALILCVLTGLPVLAADPGTAPRPLASALHAMNRGDWDRAAELAARDGPAAVTLIEWHRLRAGKGHFNEVRAFLDAHGGWPGLDLLRRRSEASLDGATDDQIIAFFREVPAQTGTGVLRFAEALMAAGEQGEAQAEIVLAWRSFDLSEAEFATAVRQALRDYTRPEFLKTNPLLRSRLVYADLPQAGDPREQLRHILAATAALMQETPKLAPFYEPLRLTYLEPAGTQEQVAEQLDLPFGTYRRHLKSGLEYLTERLWQRELGQ